VIQILKRLLKKIYILIYFKKVKIHISGNCSLRTKFEGQNIIGKRSWFDGYMGFGTYICDDCIINAKIGRYCSIGHRVTVLTGTHPAHKFVSTSPVFYSLEKQNGTSYTKIQRFDEKRFSDKANKFGITLGNDVWIGFGATFMGGVTIGDGAIVGANTLVLKDVPAYSIVAGNPAKQIGTRFDEDNIKWLCKLKWWNKPEKWIKENSAYFCDIDTFRKRFSNETNLSGSNR